MAVTAQESAMEDSSAMTANAQEFCLRWNNFHQSLVSALDGFKNDQDFVDVTLACEGQFLKAHKMLLSACSVFFRDLLKANPCQHPIVILPPEVRFADLEKLLRFIYQGEVNVHQENLARFLKTAEMLKIRGLAEDSEKRVLRSSSPRPPEGDSDSVSPKRPRLSIDVHQPSQEPQTPNDDSRLSGNDSDSEMIPVKQEMVELKDCSDSAFDDLAGDDAFIPEAYLREGSSASSSSQQTTQQAPPPNAPPPPGPLLPSYVPPPQIKSQDDSPLGPTAPDELSQGRAGVGELGSWGRRALSNPPWVMRGMVGTWGMSKHDVWDVCRVSNDPASDNTCSNSGSDVGNMLDVLSRGEEKTGLDHTTITTSSGGRLCPVCGRYISNPSNLRKHIHRAHGTRNYFCPACHKSYRVVCDLRRHALAAHNIRMDSSNVGGSSGHSEIHGSLLRRDCGSTDGQVQVSGDEEYRQTSPETYTHISTSEPHVSNTTIDSQSQFRLTSQNGYSCLTNSGSCPTTFV